MMFREAQALIDVALEIGYDGVQMLPIRGATGMETGVLVYENAWNPVPDLWHALQHMPGASDMPSNWKDWLVSPPADICGVIGVNLESRGIQYIDHKLNHSRSWVEISPELNTRAEDIAAWCSSCSQGVVIDTHHLCRPPRDGSRNYLLDEDGDWRSTVSLLSPFTRAIHVNTTGEVTREDRERTDSIIKAVLCQLRDADVEELILVAEYPPTPGTLLNPRSSRRMAEATLCRLKRLVALGCPN